MTETRRHTWNQRRAEHAWNTIAPLADAARSGRRKHADEYARAAKQLPTRILTAGLGQALAFLLAKGAESQPLRDLHEHLTGWVIGERGLPGSQSESLLQSVIHGDSGFLRRATDESLAYLGWLNRFAEAEGLGKPEKKERGEA